MHSRAVIFSTIALLLTVALLWTGYSRLGNGYNDEHGHSEYYEYASDARPGDEHEQARSLQQHGDILPLENILASARQHHEGRVLETGLQRRDGSYVYKVELLDARGQVWEMLLDARTGELIKQQRED